MENVRNALQYNAIQYNFIPQKPQELPYVVIFNSAEFLNISLTKLEQLKMIFHKGCINFMMENYSAVYLSCLMTVYLTYHL